MSHPENFDLNEESIGRFPISCWGQFTGSTNSPLGTIERNRCLAASQRNAQPSPNMLVELSIIPIGNKSHIADELAEILKIIEKSGVRFELTPSATCLEGSWADVMPLIQRCHEHMRALCPHVITSIQIEDEAGATNKLKENIRSVEKKVGRPLSANHSAGVVLE
jgi:uncharacterized protein (TIGR00106 family)